MKGGGGPESQTLNYQLPLIIRQVLKVQSKSLKPLRLLKIVTNQDILTTLLFVEELTNLSYDPNKG